jgi:acyl-CoA synthetase (NDP forming)
VPHELDRLFRPRSVAVVGASENDPSRMGTRTLHDLVASGWDGEVFPVSSRHDALYGLRTYRSLRELPTAPDVVLARTPSAGIEALVDDAIAARAGCLVVLASGFAETGDAGRDAQRRLVARARAGGVRVLGPQSIGLVVGAQRLPLTLSQLMERFVARPGPVALLTQSGAIAISLAVRGQDDVGLRIGTIATFGNSADVTQVEALEWLAGDPGTRVIGLYMEGLDDGPRFARAVARCREAGQRIAILRSGLSVRGAGAVASHTASLAGDGDAFRALCRQLGVALCEDAGAFLWTLKALSAAPPAARAPRVAFASISGGACALWADHAERLGLALPPLEPAAAERLGARLPSFLSASNPMDLGPAVFDDAAFAATLEGLLAQPGIDLLVAYLFTSSPSLMGGLDKIRLLESIGRAAPAPPWVIWEAATREEWVALRDSDALVAFPDLGAAARALASVVATVAPGGFAPVAGTPDAAARTLALDTEPAIKAWLRGLGLSVPPGRVVAGAREAAVAAADDAIGPRVALKVVAAALAHKSDVGGVVLCDARTEPVDAAAARMLAGVAERRPGLRPDGLLVERRIDGPGLELLVTVRRDPVLGWVTVVGRGGVQVEVDRDVALHVGRLPADALPALLARLRCAPLLGAFRGRPPLATGALADAIERLQHAADAAGLSELELNPVLLTVDRAWVLDALATR